MASQEIVLLFTKPPHPGRVKTRLVGDAPGALTAENAAALHWAFVLDQLERLAGRDFGLEIAWDLIDGETAPELGVAGFRQRGSDLGERLWHGLTRAARTATRVAAVGSDHPYLTRELVERAFERLRAGSDVVLGPAADGGYYLVAVRAACLDRRLFEGISWSTSSVLAQTLARCRELGLGHELLPEGRDVDTPADLGELVATLAAGGGGCPRTRDLLDDWGLL